MSYRSSATNKRTSRLGCDNDRRCKRQHLRSLPHASTGLPFPSSLPSDNLPPIRMPKMPLLGLFELPRQLSLVPVLKDGLSPRTALLRFSTMCNACGAHQCWQESTCQTAFLMWWFVLLLVTFVDVTPAMASTYRRQFTRSTVAGWTENTMAACILGVATEQFPLQLNKAKKTSVCRLKQNNSNQISQKAVIFLNLLKNHFGLLPFHVTGTAQTQPFDWNKIENLMLCDMFDRWKTKASVCIYSRNHCQRQIEAGTPHDIASVADGILFDLLLLARALNWIKFTNCATVECLTDEERNILVTTPVLVSCPGQTKCPFPTLHPNDIFSHATSQTTLLCDIFSGASN